MTTFLLLRLVVWAEIRGEPDATAFGRRISRDVQRQALTAVVLAVGLAGKGTPLLLSVSDLAVGDVLFEAISDFATVEPPTGIAADLPLAGSAGSGPSPSLPAWRCAAGRGPTAMECPIVG